jgi:hypothetical protein
MVMDSLKNPGKYTAEELEVNANEAGQYDTDNPVLNDDTNHAASCAADAVTYSSRHDADNDGAQYWVECYFRASGESYSAYKKELSNED